jgi:hypothetical protein
MHSCNEQPDSHYDSAKRRVCDVSMRIHNIANGCRTTDCNSKVDDPKEDDRANPRVLNIRRDANDADRQNGINVLMEIDIDSRSSTLTPNRKIPCCRTLHRTQLALGGTRVRTYLETYMRAKQTLKKTVVKHRIHRDSPHSSS